MSKASKNSKNNLKVKSKEEQLNRSSYQVNKILLILTIVLLMAVSYLYGKNQKPAWIGGIQTENITPALTPTPTEKPPLRNLRNEQGQSTIIPTQLVNTPTPLRKLVPVSFSTGWVKGTFYCYEDKANELMSLQNALRMANEMANHCSSQANLKYDQCTKDKCSSISAVEQLEEYKKCLDECAKVYDECIEKSKNVGDLENEIFNKKRQYCP